MAEELGFDKEFERLIAAESLEKQLHPAETDGQRATRILEEGAGVAAMSIVQLSRASSNEQLRFRASAYILDRVLGDSKGSSGTTPVWSGLFDDVTMTEEPAPNK